MTATLDLDDLRSHIGRSQVATDVIHAGPANFLRLALGRSDPELRDGDVLPPAWLGLYFLPRVASAALRPDGSPQDTGVVPSMALPRRMFAGERARFHGALRVGETVRRETRLADISMKHGGTGTLVFATVTSRVYGPDGVALEDERRTVFREEVKAGNSHRIHYDRAWAMEAEGYPGLVVHGPLTTTLLIDFARDQNPGRRIVAYTTQARAPLFDTGPLELRGRPAANGRCELWAVTPEGTVAMSAEVELA